MYSQLLFLSILAKNLRRAGAAPGRAEEKVPAELSGKAGKPDGQPGLIVTAPRQRRASRRANEVTVFYVGVVRPRLSLVFSADARGPAGSHSQAARHSLTKPRSGPPSTSNPAASGGLP